MSHDVHAGVGAYVADALGAEERVEFEAHLPGCQQCTQEVGEFSETLGRLSVLTATPPPPELRTSVLAAVQQVRPLPPLAGADEVAGPRRAVVGARTEPEPEVAAVAPVDELAVRRQRRTVRVLTGAVAAAVVLVLALGGWAASLQQRVATAGGQTSAEVELLSAPDAEVVTWELPNGGQASYAVSRQQDRAMVITPELAETDPDQTYQLWTMQVDEAGAPVLESITANDTFAGGDDLRVLFDDVRDTQALAITVEDAGGAQSPTMDTLFGFTQV